MPVKITGQSNQFSVSLAKPQPVGPEVVPHYWHPNRPDSRLAPEWFRKQLKDIDPDLECSWSPVHERWLVWCRNGRVTHRLCPGWLLLFVHQGADGTYRPLDERLLARVWQCSARANESAKKYFQRIADEIERDKEKARLSWKQDLMDMTLPFYDHSQIKISMRGASNGSKFADYLS